LIPQRRLAAARKVFHEIEKLLLGAADGRKKRATFVIDQADSFFVACLVLRH